METRSTVEAKVRVDGDPAGDALRSLDDWLRHERIAGLRTEFRRAPTAPGEMGGDLLPWLTLIASSSVLAEIIRGINAWISSRRAETVAKFEVGGKRVRVSGKGSDVKALIEELGRGGAGARV